MITIQARTLSQAAETLKSRNAPAAADGQLPTENALAPTAEDKNAEEQQSSFKVSLSDFGKRQLQALQMMQKSASNISDARKNSARMRAAQLKQQLEGMKKIAAMLGPAAAKSVLRQIKQIARELRQIAAELGEPTPAIATGGGSQADVASASAGGDADDSDASGSEEVSGNSEDTEVSEDSEISETSDVSVEAEEAVAQEAVEEARTEDTEEAEQALAGAAEQAATAAEKEVRNQENQESEQNKRVNGHAAIDSERRARGAQMKEDAKLVRDLGQDLRFLLSWAKSALLRKYKEDKDNIKDVEKQLRETEKLVENMELSAENDISGGDIDIGNIASEALSAVEASTAEIGSIDTSVPAVNVSVASISVYA